MDDCTKFPYMEKLQQPSSSSYVDTVQRYGRLTWQMRYRSSAQLNAQSEVKNPIQMPDIPKKCIDGFFSYCILHENKD